jgi:hypothetical protein
MRLDGLDGNAFSLLRAFQREAARQGWSREAIEAVTRQARSRGYSHLLATLLAHTEAPNE